MQDIESYGIVSNERKVLLLRDRIVAYLAVFMTLVALIISCVGLNMGRQSNLEKTLYTFSFPYFNQLPKVENGMVVSLDKKGYVFTGAGTTISLNVTRAKANSFEDIRVCAFSNNIIFSGSIGRLVAYEISYDDVEILNEELTLPKVHGKTRKVEAMYKINGDTIVIAGSGQLLPITVKLTVINDYKVSLAYTIGTPFEYSTIDDESYSHCDDIRDDRRHDIIACTWEEGNDLYTMIAVMEGTNEEKTFRQLDKTLYGEARKYHGLAGCGTSGYLVATVGPYKNRTQDVGPVKVAYIEITRDLKLRVSNFTNVPFEMSSGFFSLDNLHSSGAVLCYTRQASGGINCITIDVTHGPSGGVQFGSTVTISKGGSAIDEARTKMQIINRNTFALMWADQNIGGSISYQMVTLNDAGDMIKNGPAFIVSNRMRSQKIHKHIVGCSGVDDYKSFIVELVESDTGNNAYLHTTYVYPRPIGIASKSFIGSNQVQFGGVWKVTQKATKGKALNPGSMYYTNDRGMILRGPPAGYAHRSFGINYISSYDDESLLGMNNQVGMAISKTELLLKFS